MLNAGVCPGQRTGVKGPSLQVPTWEAQHLSKGVLGDEGAFMIQKAQELVCLALGYLNCIHVLGQNTWPHVYAFIITQMGFN